MSIPDLYRPSVSQSAGPARLVFGITPSDGADLVVRTSALYIGGAGNVAVRDIYDNDVTFVGVPVGTVLPVHIKRVLSTNTTATNIIGLA